MTIPATMLSLGATSPYGRALHALDPFVALGVVAAVTSTIRLIPNIVVLPYRNPFVVQRTDRTR